jgi:hypothetical protein
MPKPAKRESFEIDILPNGPPAPGETTPGGAREPGDDVVEFDPAELEQETEETERPPDNESPQPTPKTLIGGIDLDSIALAEDYAEGLADDEDLTGLSVTKPRRDWFFRTHPTHYRNVRLLEIKDGADRGYYIVNRQLWGFCQSADIPLRPVRLTLATSRESGAFLWPLKLQEQGCENRKDEWSASALRICKTAETAWVKLYTRPGGNCYSHKIAEGIKTEPAWPSQSFEELLALAFDGKVIHDLDDPLLRRIQGKE